MDAWQVVIAVVTSLAVVAIYAAAVKAEGEAPAEGDFGLVPGPPARASHYWSTTAHLGLDHDGGLWLLSGPESDEPDRRLGHIAASGAMQAVDALLLEVEHAILLDQWTDLPEGTYRDDVTRDYRRGVGL